MRPKDECPACGDGFGRTETIIRGGETVLVYWHTELSKRWEYCVEYPCGAVQSHETQIEHVNTHAAGD